MRWILAVAKISPYWILTYPIFCVGESWPNYFGNEVNWWWILTLRISWRGEQGWRLEEGRFKLVFDGCIRNGCQLYHVYTIQPACGGWSHNIRFSLDPKADSNLGGQEIFFGGGRGAKIKIMHKAHKKLPFLCWNDQIGQFWHIWFFFWGGGGNWRPRKYFWGKIPPCPPAVPPLGEPYTVFKWKFLYPEIISVWKQSGELLGFPMMSPYVLE